MPQVFFFTPVDETRTASLLRNTNCSPQDCSPPLIDPYTISCLTFYLLGHKTLRSLHVSPRPLEFPPATVVRRDPRRAEFLLLSARRCFSLRSPSVLEDSGFGVCFLCSFIFERVAEFYVSRSFSALSPHGPSFPLWPLL